MLLLLQDCLTAESLKCHIKDCFKINGKQRIKMPAKVNYVRFKNYGRNCFDMSPFMIHIAFSGILCLKIMGSKTQMSLIKTNI